MNQESEFEANLNQLQEMILSCFTISDPYYGNHPSELSHSHFDWHSSFHGLWAILSIFRIGGLSQESPHIQSILSRFSVESLGIIYEKILNLNCLMVRHGFYCYSKN
jgi:hypothetical protein